MPWRPTALTHARKAATRERILAAAQRLLAEGGYAAAHVAAVAEAAGVGTGTVYRHFPSKGDLFVEVFRLASQREVDRMAARAAAPGSTRARLRGAVEAFCERAVRGRRQAFALIAEPVDPAVEAERLRFRRAYAAILRDLVAAAVAAGECPPQDPATAAACLVGAMAEALVGPLAPDGELPPAAAAALTHEITTACERAVFGTAARSAQDGHAA